ncbi:MAG: tetratricopeptide repeat protein [Bdellovibrionota bacterium]|nr:tetratricopeptide repeat protein [Bdellovibrionota bacterium]
MSIRPIKVIPFFLPLLVISCGGIKTRKDLKIAGIEIKRNNASSGTTSTPREAEQKVVVVERVETQAPREEVVRVAQAEPVVQQSSAHTSSDPVSMKLQMASEIRRISGELQDLKDIKSEELRKSQENEMKLEERLKQMDARLAVYEQSIAALEEEIRHLKTLKTAKPTPKKGIFERAQDHMASKDWKKAILEFENYRKKYPKGRRVSLATYNIGVCFQELKLNEEAKAFYQETLDKYPKTDAFRKAKYRLNQLK